MKLILLFLFADGIVLSNQNFGVGPPSVDNSLSLAQMETMLFSKLLKISRQVKEFRWSLKQKIAGFESLLQNDKEIQTTEKDKLNLLRFSNDVRSSELKLRVKHVERSLAWDGKIRRAAFHAFLTATEESVLLDTPEESRIIFSYAPVNVNGAYNESSGKFRAPTTGLYLLATRLKVPFRQGRANFQIYVNGEIVGSAESSSFEQEENGMNGFAVVQMDSGSEAEVRSTLPVSATAMAGKQTWFMGFLINRRIEQTLLQLRIG